MKVVMVCLGNICRSPMADGLLRKKIKEAGLTVVVDSAGTANYHVGEAPDHRMIETGNKYNCDISFLRARQFSTQDFDDFDLIYAMDVSNYNNILKLSRQDTDSAKVKLILNELYPGENRSVPDPYYGGEQGFVEVYQLLNQATDVILKKIAHGR